MKLLNGFLDMMGFENTHDLVGNDLNYKLITLIAVGLGSVSGFVETWTGISVLLWVFLTLTSIFDIAFGIYANVIILKSDFESKRFFRGVFKSFVVLFIIILANMFKLGVLDSDFTPGFLKSIFDYTANAIHGTFVVLIALYLLVGISENGAKIDIPVFKSISKLLKMKINSIESITDKFPGNLPENQKEEKEDI